jgi:hypothetical protein
MQPLCLAADAQAGLVQVLDRDAGHMSTHRIDKAPEARGAVVADPRDGGGAQGHPEEVRHQRRETIPERPAIYREVWKLEREDMPFVYLWSDKNVAGIWKTVDGLHQVPDGIIRLQGMRFVK